jgi:pimeloyl-ACP methyl ester carboxylesterase
MNIPGSDNLPAGIRSRVIGQVNGLSMHVLEAGFEDPTRPCIVLLHGFPELAYSWRKTMGPLASAGYYVVAPDQRGYGWTTGWLDDYEADLAPFRFPNLVRDVLGLLWALGRSSAECIVGHDFGSPVAGFAALIRPDVFKSAVMMSAPFPGAPPVPVPGATAPDTASLHAALARLKPPRKHYQHYYSSREANDNMWHCPQGVHDFLRAYYHHKSADWPGNQPFPLQSVAAEEFAKLPSYYVMALDKGMAETVAAEMPTAGEVANCSWLTDHELAVYSEAYTRTGFQGALNWYRCLSDPTAIAEMRLFAGRTLDVPSMFVAGAQDWGIYQMPGALEQMQTRACTRMTHCHFVEGAGHWVQQEQALEVTARLLEFLGRDQ